MTESHPCYSVSKVGQATAITYYTESGDVHFFPTGFLKHGQYNAEDGTIDLNYGFGIVTLAGIGLKELFEPIFVKQRVSSVTALPQPEDQNQSIWVSQIVISIFSE